ncbi:MAG: hypothetical protein J5J00_01455 [Deltaproteobacteria bacterium]|nr:hypothetical protein [Deltaproteobacteria bacterium]
MKLKNWIVFLVCLILPGYASTEPTETCETLPWPPTAEQRQQIGGEIKTVLERSEVPEAKELLQYLPPTDKYNYDGVGSESRVYYGEWRLSDDGCTLWTARIRNELIRHQYEIRFKFRAGNYLGSDLGVITAHAKPKRK